MDIKLEGMRFIALYHGTSNGTMRRGYHCPTCGVFYAEGNYTIESETKILGRSMQVFCCNERSLSVPYLFEEEHEIQHFLESINMNVTGVRALLIQKTNMIAALFNPSAIAEYKKKHFN